MRILLADDHVMMRDGLRPFLMQLADSTEIYEASTFNEMLRILDDTDGIRLIMIDLRMPGMTLGSGLTMLRERYPLVRVAVLSAVSERRQIMEAMALGAAGYIPKQLSAQAMLSALRLIIAGERYIPAALLEGSAPAPSPLTELDGNGHGRVLTVREREILELLREGLPNKMIARRLSVSEVTVKSHLCHIFRKLGVQNRVQAARYAASVELHTGISRARPSSV